MAAPYGQKPSEEEWLTGPWAQEIRGLQAYALTEQDPEAPFTFPEGLLDVMKPFTGGSLRAVAACELLKQLGVWGLHDHLPLLRARLTDRFDPSLEVRIRLHCVQAGDAAALRDKANVFSLQEQQGPEKPSLRDLNCGRFPVDALNTSFTRPNFGAK